MLEHLPSSGSATHLEFPEGPYIVSSGKEFLIFEHYNLLEAHLVSFLLQP